jgi:hypothetical protein
VKPVRNREHRAALTTIRSCLNSLSDGRICPANQNPLVSAMTQLDALLGTPAVARGGPKQLLPHPARAGSRQRALLLGSLVSRNSDELLVYPVTADTP